MLLAVCLMLATLAPWPREEPLIVSAAVSMSEALEEISAAYRSGGGGPAHFNLAGSNVLARQIVSGAPVDVFISADAAQMEVIARAGLVTPGTRVEVAANRLVVIVRHGAPAREMSPHDLAGEGVRRLAIGDPAAVPAGAYARSYLEAAGLWGRLADRIVPTSNVRAAVAAVQNGTVDAAIVYATDARVSRGVRVAATLTGPAAPRIVYTACVLAASKNRPAAVRFLEFLRSPEAARVLERHGFAPVPPAA